MAVVVDLPMAEIRAFCRQWQVTEFALFGSVLRSDFRPDSDIDVLLTFAPTAQRGLSEMLQMRDQLQDIFGREVDVIVRSALERSQNWRRKQNILGSAKVIYDARSRGVD